MTIYDISRPLDAARLAGWPGDTPFAFSLAWRQDAGASVNVGRVTMSVHAGTHVDAPFHFDANGPTIDALPLAPFVGPACVLDVSEAAAATGLITPDDLAPAVLLLGDAPRLLLRTDAWPDSARFPDAVPALTLDSVAWLHAHGMLLVGLDLPSFDALDSQSLPIHHALAGAGICLLEGLDLRGVPPSFPSVTGEPFYELIAPPLRIVGADAAPVRALLIRRDRDRV